MEVLTVKLVNLIADTLRNIGRILVVDKSKLQVDQKSDRYGNSYWNIYDYATNKSYSFGSEREVRAWIDKRYYSAY